MTSDNEIYQSIGEILLAIAPENATVVYLDAQVSPEGDHGKMLFDYDIEGGDTQWFTPESGRVSRDLLLQLVKLRAFFAQNNLFEQGKPWRGCRIKLDLRTAKFSADFRYD